MKISSVIQSSGAAATNNDEGRSAGAERIARAKAVAAGQLVETTPEPLTHQDAQIEKIQNSIKKIQMRTRGGPVRPERLQEIVDQSLTAPEVEAVTEPVVDNLATNEPATEVSEETKPLSPQFAALMKQKRELQLERQKFAEEKAQLDAEKQGMLTGYISKESLKSAPLKTLMDQGVTYDELTQAVLSDQSNPEIMELREKIKSLEEGFNKNLSDRDQQVERQVLGDIRKDVDRLVAQGDDFEMVRESGYAPKVVDLIHRTWKQTGELLDVTEAAALIENELLEDSLKFARLKKVQSKLTPAQVQQQQVVQQDNPNRKIMRTLTNRDGASTGSLSRKERAMLAFEGRLNKG